MVEKVTSDTPVLAGGLIGEEVLCLKCCSLGAISATPLQLSIIIIRRQLITEATVSATLAGDGFRDCLNSVSGNDYG